MVESEGGAGNGDARAGGEGGTLGVEDGRAAELLDKAVERGDGMERRADVVAEDGGQQIGGGTDDGDVAGSGLER